MFPLKITSDDFEIFEWQCRCRCNVCLRFVYEIGQPSRYRHQDINGDVNVEVGTFQYKYLIIISCLNCNHTKVRCYDKLNPRDFQKSFDSLPKAIGFLNRASEVD